MKKQNFLFLFLYCFSSQSAESGETFYYESFSDRTDDSICGSEKDHTELSSATETDILLSTENVQCFPSHLQSSELVTILGQSVEGDNYQSGQVILSPVSLNDSLVCHPETLVKKTIDKKTAITKKKKRKKRKYKKPIIPIKSNVCWFCDKNYTCSASLERHLRTKRQECSEMNDAVFTLVKLSRATQ